MKSKSTSDALKSVFPAGNDQYHARMSIAQNGKIMHGAALAEVFYMEGLAKNESEALRLASVEIQRTEMLEQGVQLHKKARKLIDARNKESAGSYSKENAHLLNA